MSRGEPPRVLTLDAGPVTLRMAVVHGDRAVAERVLDPWHGDRAALADFTTGYAVDTAAVRIPHGGVALGPVPLTDRWLDTFTAVGPAAGPAQARAVAVARAVIALLPGITVHGCPDTTFHADMPLPARLCALPAEVTGRHGIRRRGFHGLSVAHAVRRSGALLGRDPTTLRLIVARMGSGTSVTAVDRGRAVHTTMGYSPGDGLPGATTSGTLDPEIVLTLLEKGGGDTGSVRHLLGRASGLAGLSGTSGDVRALVTARSLGEERATAALALYTHRVAREIAAARIDLDGLDAVVLTGGVAEHHPGLREEILCLLRHLDVPTGLGLLAEADTVLAHPGRPAVLVVRSRTDLEMARQVSRLTTAKRT